MTYEDLEALVFSNKAFEVGGRARVLQCLDGSWGVRELKFYETDRGIAAKSRYAEMVPELVRYAFDHEDNSFRYIGTLLKAEADDE